MINTISKFYYGLTITSQNKYLDFNEGSGDLVAIIPTGNYTPEDLAQAVEDALNDAGVNSYTVSFNRSTRIITITASSSTTFKASTGTYVALGYSIFSTLGYPATNSTTTTYTASSAIGSVYTPQYKLQDYVSESDYREQRNQTVAKSASGKVEMQSFGVDRFFEFSIKFITNIKQPSSGPITNNSSGVENARSFMQWCIEKAYVEFMPDKDTPSTYYRVVLEKSSSSDGTGYKLQEQFTKGLVGYYETGLLTFRIIED